MGKQRDTDPPESRTHTSTGKHTHTSRVHNQEMETKRNPRWSTHDACLKAAAIPIISLVRIKTVAQRETVTLPA